MLTQIVNVFIGLVSGKLIAEYILPEQFGLFNLQFAAFTFFFSLLVGPSINFLKASYQSLLQELGYRPFFIILSVSGSILVFVLIMYYSFNGHINNSENIFYLLLILVIPFNILSSVASDQFNVLDKINLFSLSSILKSAAGLGYLVLLFYVFQHPSQSYVVLWQMQVLIGLVGVIYFFSKLKSYPIVKAINYKEFLNKHFHFTGPLMVLAFWSWINNYFDRFAIEAYMSLEDVGIYNANYGLGSKFFLMLSPIFMVLLTPFVYQDNKIYLKKKMIQKYVFVYFLIGVLILSILYFLTDFIGRILLSQSYSVGFYIIFWTAFAFLILTATFLYETIFYANHNTKVILYSNILSALVNILFNILLIPFLGLNGAIIALITSVLVRFSFVYFKFKKV